MRTVLAILRVMLALLTLTAIGWQLTLHVNAGYSLTNFFSYFTNLSNLFAACVLLFCAFARRSDAQDRLRYVSTVNMAVVGLVFAVLLRNVDLGALLPWVNVTLHAVMPVAIVLDWLIDPPRRPLKARHALLCLVFLALYLAYVIIRGAAMGWYPYPFLNPAIVGGGGAVAAYSVGIGVAFLAASGVLFGLGNRRVRSRDERRSASGNAI